MLTATFSEKNLSGSPGFHEEDIWGLVSTKMSQPVGHRDKTTGAGLLHSGTHKKSVYKELQVT